MNRLLTYTAALAVAALLAGAATADDGQHRLMLREGDISSVPRVGPSCTFAGRMRCYRTSHPRGSVTR
jgi:hypothetical protein